MPVNLTVLTITMLAKHALVNNYSTKMQPLQIWNADCNCLHGEQFVQEVVVVIAIVEVNRMCTV